MRMPFALAAVALVLAACTPSGTASPSSPAGGAPVTDPDAPLAAFYGDSYTLGTGASRPGEPLVERHLRRSRLARVQPERQRPRIREQPQARHRPAVARHRAGSRHRLRDDGAQRQLQLRRAPATTSASRSTPTSQRLKAELPDARFIVVEPFWYTDERPDSLEVIAGWVHDAADRDRRRLGARRLALDRGPPRVDGLRRPAPQRRRLRRDGAADGCGARQSWDSDAQRKNRRSSRPPGPPPPVPPNRRA